MGVWKARVADEKSRNIFFVSMARSLGIPAWIDEVTGKIQYRTFNDNNLKNGKVYDVDFEAAQQTQAPTGTLVARYRPIPSLSDPNTIHTSPSQSSAMEPSNSSTTTKVT